jgi:ribonuclease Z
MARAVGARLHSYSWNLVGSHSADFILEVADVAGGVLSHWTAFRARAAFVPEPLDDTPLQPGIVLDEDDLRLEIAILDHGIPCLAIALQETLRVHVDPVGLARLGLPVGCWLNAAKTAIRRSDPDDAPIAVGERMILLGLLRREAFRTAPGQRLVYVTDAAPTEANAHAIVALARGADQLFIEAAFLQEDLALAQERRHLTAHGAGILARDAAVRQLAVHHHSPRYMDRPHALRQEAEAAFAGD